MVEMLSFDEKIIQAKFIVNNRPQITNIRIRWDPLTRKTCRITSERSEERPFRPELFEDYLKHTENCVFCENNLEKQTPEFIPPFPSRLKRETSICFPNLFPYGVYSAVCVFSPKLHYIALGEFKKQLYEDCLTNSLEYLKLITKVDSQMEYFSITQNYLPSSGGTLVHPHLQVHADNLPVTYLNETISASKKYYQTYGTTYWLDLIQHEQQTERYIKKVGSWHWLVPFAPQGFQEVIGISSRETIFEITPEDLSSLAQSLLIIQQYYRDSRFNSFNLALYSTRNKIKGFNTHIRVVRRANFAPFYRNDQSFFELMFQEAAINELPENTACILKKYF